MLVSQQMTNTEHQKYESVSPTFSQWLQLQQHSSELQLLKLLQQYRHTTGWVIIVAPGFKPTKSFWHACQLPLARILVIHPKANHDLSQLIQKALCNTDCQVVINCKALSLQQQQRLSNLALQQQRKLHLLAEAPLPAH